MDLKNLALNALFGLAVGLAGYMTAYMAVMVLHEVGQYVMQMQLVF